MNKYNLLKLSATGISHVSTRQLLSYATSGHEKTEQLESI